MPVLGSRRLIVALSVLGALLGLSASIRGATTPDAGQAPSQAPASLAGQLLVASPAMGDPRFKETVVLMVQHDRSGALGIIINRPVAERPLAALLDALGESSAGVSGTMRLFVGGPVQPEIGLVLHSADYQRPESIVVDRRFAMTGSREIFRDIAKGAGPAKSLLAFGYAGWGAGQLEGELKLNAWFIAPADSRLVFDEDREKVWELAMERRTRDL